MAVLDVLNANNATFCIFITWSGILLIKVMLMTIVTVYHRFKNNASMNPEDVFWNKNFEVKINDDVERVRRAHLNDLENVVPFIIICFLFILSEPNEIFASWLIRIVGLSRIAHSIIYVCQVQQPFRAICFYITYVISLYMILSSIVYFIKL
ncbi:unnamed protein product [Chironomus riparius]|uniref:Microsomal glutathione S-transferase 1 n=1 Tax=Chironomus riparius TaxID=315576 RepID=A0A9N9RU27_9DIPT|nr:unnamed protein product [Chironomus riparius]